MMKGLPQADIVILRHTKRSSKLRFQNISSIRGLKKQLLQ
jgi:hypothetical protein